MSQIVLVSSVLGAAGVHYANPYGEAGCMKGELNMTVDHIPGLFCAPKCDDILYENGCPQDKPSGKALGMCMIGFQSERNNYCALICNTDAADAGNDQCDVAGGARCWHVSGTMGVCTYGMASVPGATMQGRLQVQGVAV